MSDILTKIDAYQREEIAAAAKRALPLPYLKAFARRAPSRRGFLSTIRNRHAAGEHALIAEIKKASPSKGLIRADFDPPSLAKAYEADGVAYLFVLTATAPFQGHVEVMVAARAGTTPAMLRQDVLYDSYQGREARAHAADCILVIMVAPDDAIARDIEVVALAHVMEARIENCDRAELDRALTPRSPTMGQPQAAHLRDETCDQRDAGIPLFQRSAGRRPKTGGSRTSASHYRPKGDKQ